MMRGLLRRSQQGYSGLILILRMALIPLMVLFTAYTPAKAAGPPDAQQQVTLVGTEFAFTPTVINLTAGQPVQLTIRNGGVLDHDIKSAISITGLTYLSADNPADEQQANSAAGTFHVDYNGGHSATVVFTPTQVGTYEFYCSLPGHQAAGMKGTFVVGPSTATATNATPAEATNQQAVSGIGTRLPEPHAALAAEPTLVISVSPAAALGERVTLEATLTQANGAGIANQTIVFTSWTTFLNTAAEMVLAEAMTNKQGIAVAQYQVRQVGLLALKASFAGTDGYAPAKGSGQITVSGSQQLYEEEAGVKLPGLNEAPAEQTGTGPWALSGWPIAAVLVTVWSLFGSAVFFLFQIVRAQTGAPANRD
jgi:uncharacterized cupredoxin-like copper-binding protein